MAKEPQRGDMWNSPAEIGPSASLGDRAVRLNDDLGSARSTCTEAERSRGLTLLRRRAGARAESRALFSYWGLSTGDGYARHHAGVSHAKA